MVNLASSHTTVRFCCDACTHRYHHRLTEQQLRPQSVDPIAVIDSRFDNPGWRVLH